ncbi:hypothetical protein AVEN_220521-1 [Araneus ventricosus]|uniref:Uncharacterized protein n=1 Tax=Araneus ventricosus TaxID=182803 RepID=A0A4Y2WU64_ARAVE|nr:hypothetical protein AVEN_220521-1 [Araneus ventricosus]
MGCHARPTRGSNLLSMRSRKQTERQLLLMESSLAYPRGKEVKRRNSKRRQNSKGEQTLEYLGAFPSIKRVFTYQALILCSFVDTFFCCYSDEMAKVTFDKVFRCKYSTSDR